MSYEVIKRVGGRAYRYSVESYRDKVTGKQRAKWTYMGVATDDAIRTVKPKRDTRAMIVSAFLKLHETIPLSKMSPTIVAEAAGVAYGTFYHYFDSLENLVEAVMKRCEHCSGEGWIA